MKKRMANAPIAFTDPRKSKESSEERRGAEVEWFYVYRLVPDPVLHAAIRRSNTMRPFWRYGEIRYDFFDNFYWESIKTCI